MVTAEELHLVVAEAQTAGVLEESERAIISGIVRLADRPVREVMTPRTEVDWIDIHAPGDEVRTALREHPHSRLPVADGSVDNIVGVVQTRDLLTALLDGQPLDLQAMCRQAPVIPDLMDAMDALAVLRAADVPLALVHDEYGHFDGIVTPGSPARRARRGVRPRPRRRRRSAAASSARTAAGWCRARRAPTCFSDRLGMQHAGRARFLDRRRLRPVGAQAYSGDRRALQA